MTTQMLRELLAKATPGPYGYTRRTHTPIVYANHVEDGHPYYGKTIAMVPWIDDANGELLAAAVNALGALLDVVDAAERYSHVRVAGCLCCNPEACDACPLCPKCELDAALRAFHGEPAPMETGTSERRLDV